MVDKVEQVGAVKPGFRKEVVATATGYYGGSLQKPGDHFVLVAPEHFSDSWMKEPEKGASNISDRDRDNALAAHAGAVGRDGQTVEYKGKAMTRDDVVDEAVIGPTDIGQPRASKRAAPPADPKQVISQGAVVEVAGDHVFGPEPVANGDTGKLEPNVPTAEASAHTRAKIDAAKAKKNKYSK